MPFELIVIIAVYVMLAIVGLLGNIWVMWTVLSQLLGCGSGGRPHKPPLQSSAFIYLLLLSVVDMISFLPIPLLVTDLMMSRWPFGLSICKFLFICEGTNKTLSPLVLTALSIDRYIAVCKPTLVWMRQTRFSLLVVLICVLLSMTFIVPIGIQAKIESMPFTPIFSVNKCALSSIGFLEVAQVIACYVIPLLLICSVYTAILKKLYRDTRIVSVGRKTSISLSRVVKCSVLVVAFYFICWTPYFTMRLHYSLAGDPEPEMEVETSSDDQSFAIFLQYMLHALPYIRSAFNWLFYAFLNSFVELDERQTEAHLLDKTHIFGLDTTTASVERISNELKYFYGEETDPIDDFPKSIKIETSDDRE